MIGYLLGVLCGVVAVIAASLLAGAMLEHEDVRVSVSMGMLVIGMVMSAWIGAEIVQLVSPRMALARGGWSVRAWVVGLISAVVGCAGLMVLYALLPHEGYLSARISGMNVGVACGAMAVISAAGLWLGTARLERGTCVGCGYNLRSLTVSSGGKCPECGRALFAAAGR